MGDLSWDVFTRMSGAHRHPDLSGATLNEEATSFLDPDQVSILFAWHRERERADESR